MPFISSTCSNAAHLLLPQADKGGEDAFFVSSAGLGGFGVADGVGGWAADGIDPALYSRALMENASSCLESNGAICSALDVVDFAHKRTKHHGSATACVAIMKPEGNLEVANIGDCGIRVFRGQKCTFATKVGGHRLVCVLCAA